jgi:hypothetical protein
VLQLGAGVNIAGVNSAATTAETLVVAGAATMTTAQHEAFATVTGEGSADAITLTTGGAVTAAAAVETYVLSNAGNDLTVNAEKLNVNVTGGSDDDTVIVGAGLAVTGTYALGGGTDVLQLGDGADISGVNEGDATTAETLVVAGAATMTTAQHEAFATVTGEGSADAITLTTGGAVTAAAAVETYVLSDEGNDLTVNAEKLDVNVTGGDGDDKIEVRGLVLTGGDFQLNGGSNVLRLDDGADISAVTLGATGGTFAFSISPGSSVTMSVAQHEGAAEIGVFGDDPIAQITLSDAGNATGDADVLAYVLADGDQTFTIGAAGQAVTTGSGSVTISTSVVTGALDGSAGTVTLDVSAGTLDFSGVTLTSIETLAVASDATVTLTAAQASGMTGSGSGSGSGTVIVTGLGDTTDLSAFSAGLTLEVTVTNNIDVTANTNLGPIDEISVAADAELTISVAQLTALALGDGKINGEGNVVVTGVTKDTPDFSLLFGSNVNVIAQMAENVLLDQLPIWADSISLNGFAVTVDFGDLPDALDEPLVGPGRLIVTGVTDGVTIDLDGLPANISVALEGLSVGQSVSVQNWNGETVTPGAGQVAVFAEADAENATLTVSNSIAAAFTAATVGNSITMGEGTHLLAAPLIVNKVGLTFAGLGMDLTRIELDSVTRSTETRTIEIRSTDVTVQDLALGGWVADAVTSNAGRGYLAWVTNTGHNATFDSVKFENDHTRVSVFNDRANGFTVENSVFEGTLYRYAIRGNGTDMSIQGNVFDVSFYEGGPIYMDRAVATSGVIVDNQFNHSSGVTVLSADASGQFKSDGSETQTIAVLRPDLLTADGLEISNNSFSFQSATVVNVQTGVTPQPVAILLPADRVASGPLKITNNNFDGYGYQPQLVVPEIVFDAVRDSNVLAMDGLQAFASFTMPIDIGEEGSFSAWVKIDADAIGRRNQIFEGPGDGGFELQYRTNTGGQFYGSPGGSSYVIMSGGATAYADDWTNVQLTWDKNDGPGGVMRLYVNGAEVSYLSGFGSTVSGWTEVLDTAAGQFFVGRDPGDASRMFKGMLDDVAFFRSALNETDLALVRNGPLNVSVTPSLIAYWSFDENSDEASLLGSGGTSIGLELGSRLATPPDFITFTAGSLGVVFENNSVAEGEGALVSRFSGSQGNDVYQGTLAVDAFVFRSGVIGDDVLKDFSGAGVVGGDILDFSAISALTDIDDLDIAVADGSTVITSSAFVGSITLIGVTTALTNDDFLFTALT